MKKKYLFPLACLALWACSRQELTPEAVPSDPDPVPVAEEAAAPSSAVLRLTPDMAALIEADVAAGSIRTKSAPMNAALDELGIQSLRRVFPDAGEFEPRTRAAGLHLFYEVTWAEDMPRTKAAGVLESIPGVEEVEFPLPIAMRAVFNDPNLPLQWNYYNDGETDGYRAGADVNVLPLWEAGITGNPAVIVNVVDQGVLLTHPDLAGNTIEAGEEGSYNFITDSEGVLAPGSHGTHVAGTIAAINNNGIGVSGIAGGDAAKGQPGVRILSSQIFGPTDKDADATTAGTARAIKWGADHGAVISQNSWGYIADTNGDGYVSAAEKEAFKRVSIPSTIRSAIDYFIQYAGCDNEGRQLPDSPMRGGLVFFAAGNENLDYDPIGSYEPVISVGSFGPTGKKAYYSNYGPWVDLAAPGGDVYEPSRSNYNTVLSLSLNNSYTRMQGTSMACPHASGVAALILSVVGGYGFTNDMLRDAVLSGADRDFFTDNTVIGPKVDAAAALGYFEAEVPGAAQSLTATADRNTVTVSSAVTADNSGLPAKGAVVFLSPDRSVLEHLDPSAVPAGVVASTVVFDDTVQTGDPFSVTLENLNYETTYHAVVFMFNRYRQLSDRSPLASATTGINLPPVIETDYDGDYRFPEYTVATIPFRIHDPEGHDFSVELVTEGRGFLSGSADSGIWTFRLSCDVQGAGTFKTLIRATDSYGKIAEKDITYTVLPNNPPVIVREADPILLGSPGDKRDLDVTPYFTDPDGETLRYAAVSNSQGVMTSLAETKLTLTAVNYGLSEILVTARDFKSSVTLAIPVLVRQSGVEVDFYPNPVSDRLYVRPGLESQPTHVVVTSSTGKVVADLRDQADAFHPLTVDLREAAPGRYHVKVTYGSKEYTQTVVKR